MTQDYFRKIVVDTIRLNSMTIMEHDVLQKIDLKNLLKRLYIIINCIT